MENFIESIKDFFDQLLLISIVFPAIPVGILVVIGFFVADALGMVGDGPAEPTDSWLEEQERLKKLKK